MHTIKFSPLALEDLIEIKKYISEELDDISAAQRISSAILKRINSLKTFPLLGESLNSKIDIHTKYRYLVCENYLVFYYTDNQQVFIVRVLYAKSDYLSTLISYSK